MKEPDIIELDVFDLQIAIFKSLKHYVKYFKKVLKLNIKQKKKDKYSSRGYAMFEVIDGVKWHSFILPDNAKPETIVHEISHMTDLILHYNDIPSGIKNTELRAYISECLFRQISNIRLNSADKL